MSAWQKISSKVVHKNPWYEVHEHAIIRPNGKNGVYFIVEAGDGVFVVPETADKKVVFIKMNRITTGVTSWELPGGAVDPGEDARAAAARELAEETGYSAKTLVPLGQFQQLAGKSSAMGYAFIARDLTLGAHEQEDEGIIESRAFTPMQIKAMIGSGEISDSMTLTTLLQYFNAINHITP